MTARQAGYGFALAAALVVSFWMALPAYGQEETGAAVSNSPVAEMESIQKARKTYTYLFSDNRDPFKSLIMDVGDMNKQDIGKEPTELYDIELIKVVAIVIDEEGEQLGYGLVRLPDGKHYTVKVGTPIGIHEGKVVDILPNKLVVKQNVMDFRRRLVEQTRELKLREEEDQ